MKKVFVICILAATAAAALTVACTGVPQNVTEAPVPETAGNSMAEAHSAFPPAGPPALPPEPEFEPDTLSLGEIEEIEEIEEPSPPLALSEAPPLAETEDSPLETESSIAEETDLSPEQLPELTEAETAESTVDITEATPTPAPPPVTVSVPTTPPPAVTPPPPSPSTPPLAAVTPPPPVTPPAPPPAAIPATPPSPVAPPAAPRSSIQIQNNPSPEDPAESSPSEVSPPDVEAKPLSPAETPPRETVPRVVQGIPYPSAGATGDSGNTVFSRTVRVVAGQIVEIPFRGTGWVYLGETGGRQGVFYESRRFDPEGQSFIFRVDLAGVYSLKFYRQDFIRNFIFNDYVQIIAEEAPETAGRFGSPVDRGRVVAEPRWPSTIEEAAALRGRQPVPAATDTAQSEDSPSAVLTTTPPLAATTPPVSTTPSATPAPQAATTPPPATAPSVPTTPATPARTSPPVVPPPATAPVVPPTPPAQAPAATPPVTSGAVGTTGVVNGNTTPEQPAEASPYAYLEKAREEYDAGRIVPAISFLDLFREYFPSGSDEAWWLYGQCYEANSPARDILASLEYYRRLLQEYPQSERIPDARRRISYLERLYINIR